MKGGDPLGTGISGVQGQAQMDMYQNALQFQVKIAGMFLQNMNATSQVLSGALDGQGAHAMEPGRGQNVNVLA